MFGVLHDPFTSGHQSATPSTVQGLGGETALGVSWGNEGLGGRQKPSFQWMKAAGQLVMGLVQASDNKCASLSLCCLARVLQNGMNNAHSITT